MTLAEAHTELRRFVPQTCYLNIRFEFFEYSDGTIDAWWRIDVQGPKPAVKSSQLGVAVEMCRAQFEPSSSTVEQASAQLENASK